MTSDVGQVYDRPGALIRQGSAAHDRCTADGAKGLEVSPCRLRQDHLVQRQGGYRASETLVLALQLLQSFQLITVHAAILLAPSVVGLHRHTDLPDCIRNRPSLPLQHLNLPQFRYDLLGLVSLSNHSLVLLKWDIPIPVGGPLHGGHSTTFNFD